MNGTQLNEGSEKDTHASSSTATFEIVRQQRFEVCPRYTDLKFIGEGAYGMYMNKKDHPVVVCFVKYS
jgi:hypothetical protein